VALGLIEQSEVTDRTVVSVAHSSHSALLVMVEYLWVVVLVEAGWNGHMTNDHGLNVSD
jgi:hypothetical protein